MGQFVGSVFLVLTVGWASEEAVADAVSEQYACMAATGEKILLPWSKQTSVVIDGGKRVNVPENMVYVPAGAFTMGDRESKHRVFLDAYCIGKYEVTNAEWYEFLVDTRRVTAPRHWKNGKFPEGKGNHPVLWVSWDDALRYCGWMSQRTGWNVTLPTQAQWEKAARGPDAFFFPWGNERSAKHCNYNGVCASKLGLTVGSNGVVAGWKEFTTTTEYREFVGTSGYTTPVGSFPTGKSFYGCYDMAGNAYEWCLDWYKKDYYRLKDAGTNPLGPAESEADVVNEPGYSGIAKLIRGGSWYAHLMSCSAVSHQEVRNPRYPYHSVGFRVVAEMPSAISPMSNERQVEIDVTKTSASVRGTNR